MLRNSGAFSFIGGFIIYVNFAAIKKTTMSKGPVSEFIQYHYRHFNAAALVDAAKGYENTFARRRENDDYARRRYEYGGTWE